MTTIPGDAVQGAHFGPGVWATPTTEPVACIAGELHSTSRATYVSGNGGRYIPSKGDYVIGTVTQRLSEVYRVQLQPHSKPVRLGHFAFEGANKKNRPNLQTGDTVYGRIVRANTLTEAVIECMDNTGKSNGFGPLVGGYTVQVSLSYARHLLFEGHPLLEQLGKKYTFEMAIGVNGVVWIKGEDAKMTLKVINAIKRAEGMSVDEALKKAMKE